MQVGVYCLGASMCPCDYVFMYLCLFLSMSMCPCFSFLKMAVFSKCLLWCVCDTTDRDGAEGAEYRHGIPGEQHEASPAVQHHPAGCRLSQTHAKGGPCLGHGLQKPTGCCGLSQGCWHSPGQVIVLTFDCLSIIS